MKPIIITEERFYYFRNNIEAKHRYGLKLVDDYENRDYGMKLLHEVAIEVSALSALSGTSYAFDDNGQLSPI